MLTTQEGLPRSGLRARLAGSAQPLLATFVVIPRVEIVEALAASGFDLVILDCEHGPYAIESVPPLLAAATAAGITAVVRVPDTREHAIGAALDAGADGVLIPRVTTPGAARAAVAAARFAPEGDRGANPYVRANRYGTRPVADYFAVENARRAALLMIESLEAVEAIDEIAAIPSLDAFFLGPFDLSAGHGVPGQLDHPKVTAAITRVVEAARRHGVATAAFANSPDAAQRLRALGIEHIALGVDSKLVAEGFAAAAAAVSLSAD
jgi:2-keto-3-deoxy-L-rhamnonate aldolase RhmA